MSSCLSCEYCYKGWLCALFDELIDGTGCCFMHKKEQINDS